MEEWREGQAEREGDRKGTQVARERERKRYMTQRGRERGGGEGKNERLN